ncbi:MAG: excalibur calcium-binding domain-containing protein, partial [Cyanobacteriota bacterium]|nr:excalibur calcium-binding domain-containing protein [Cyanobacteriota bacterium]
MRSLRSGNTRIDGDGDGIPCESLCRGGGNTTGSRAPTRQAPASTGSRQPIPIPITPAPRSPSPAVRREATPAAAGPAEL